VSTKPSPSGWKTFSVSLPLAAIHRSTRAESREISEDSRVRPSVPRHVPTSDADSRGHAPASCSHPGGDGGSLPGGGGDEAGGRVAQAHNNIKGQARIVRPCTRTDARRFPGLGARYSTVQVSTCVTAPQRTSRVD
jgi:hypothetical protein